MTRTVRDATPEDGAACSEIYAPYVADTAITFETEAPDAAAFTRRIAAAHAWLVLEEDGQVLGYAYATPFHPRAAYRWACEVSVYVRRGRKRTGAGGALYTALLDRVTARGFTVAVALITMPNDPSIGLHRKLGFDDAGLLRNVGYKLGAWHDVAYLQRPLATPGDPPAEPG